MPDHTTIQSLEKSSIQFVGVDWGSSRFRLTLFGQQGALADAITTDAGISTLSGGDILTYLNGHLQALDIPTTVTVILSGMAGARHGLQEVSYLDTPVLLSELGRQLERVVGDRPMWIVPGVRTAEPSIDVMRGEEVQLAGASQAMPPSTSCCLPGTHSKRVGIEDGAIVEIETAITGELFALLSIRSALVSGPQQWSDEAFATGVLEGANNSKLLTQLFRVRARVVTGQYPAEQAESYLSGLLIGSELGNWQSPDTVQLIGDPQLTSRYATAFDLLHIHTRQHDGLSCAQQGLMNIWRQHVHD